MSEITINGEIYTLEKKDVNESGTVDTNTGNCNTGDWNAGDRNTGDWNAGDRNTGDRNAGNRNTGGCNTGDRNTGGCNTGNRNTGGWNTTNYSTGFFNTEEKDIFIFNKKTTINRCDIQFPDFCYIRLTSWISIIHMTEKERAENPEYKTAGGYLKRYEYKEAFRNSWDNAPLDDRKKILLVPNFDNEIFKEITGIDVNKELNLTKQTKQEMDNVNFIKKNR